LIEVVRGFPQRANSRNQIPGGSLRHSPYPFLYFIFFSVILEVASPVNGECRQLRGF